MPKAEFFTKLGFFVARNFLTPTQCTCLQSEIREAIGYPAKVLLGGEERSQSEGGRLPDEEFRKTTLVPLTSATLHAVRASLEALLPTLASFFQLPLTGLEPLQCLRYRSQDFFAPHRDRNPDPDTPHWVQTRQISVVMFLNEATLETYQGGELTFYGVLEDPLWQNYGFSLQGETGMLVAFPSDLLHEVQPVLTGERYTIVTWFNG